MKTSKYVTIAFGLVLTLLGQTHVSAAQAAALAIGLNSVDPAHYGGWSGPLRACEFDAQDMEKIAKDQGFATQLLLTRAATRKAVIDSLDQFATSLAAGDSLIVSYSGHGGQTPDRNGDENDAQDETWCLYDGQLLDDELAAAWAKFKAGVRVCVYSDSCHSGTVTRFAYYLARVRETPALDPALGDLQKAYLELDGERNASAQPVETMLFRAMPESTAVATYVQNREFYDELQNKTKTEKETLRSIQATVILISGCQDNQLSADGTFNGLFTAKLKLIWSAGAFQGSHPEFRDAIVAQMPAHQSPNYYVIGGSNPSFEAERPWTK